MNLGDPGGAAAIDDRAILALRETWATGFLDRHGDELITAGLLVTLAATGPGGGLAISALAGLLAAGASAGLQAADGDVDWWRVVEHGLVAATATRVGLHTGLFAVESPALAHLSPTALRALAGWAEGLTTLYATQATDNRPITTTDLTIALLTGPLGTTIPGSRIPPLGRNPLIVHAHTDPPPNPLPIDRISPRQGQIAVLVGEGHTIAEIADRLHISTGTVQAHLARIEQRLGLTRADLVDIAAGRPPKPLMLDALTATEYRVFDLMARGLTYPQIADQLGITLASVNQSGSQVIRKLNLRSSTHAPGWAVDHGLPPPPRWTPDELSAGRAQLTANERAVAGLLAQGYTQRQIASRLHLTESVVRHGAQRARIKLGRLGSDGELAYWAVTATRAGLRL